MALNDASSDEQGNREIKVFNASSQPASLHHATKLHFMHRFCASNKINKKKKANNSKVGESRCALR